MRACVLRWGSFVTSLTGGSKKIAFCRQPAFSWNWSRDSSATDGSGGVEFAVSSPVKAPPPSSPIESARSVQNTTQMPSAQTHDMRAKQLTQGDVSQQPDSRQISGFQQLPAVVGLSTI